MKMLTVYVLLYAMIALSRAADDIPGTEVPGTEAPTQPLDDYGFMNGWTPSCPDGWKMFSTRCLIYVPEKLTWTSALTKCQDMQGDLASVYDTEYADEILDVMQSAGQKSGQIWVGGMKEESTWLWNDGMSTQFHKWCAGAPAGETCVKITFEGKKQGCLEDMACDAQLPSVCSIIIM